MTPDDVAAIRATYSQYPVLALADALEAAWAALARVRALLRHDGPVHHAEIRAAIEGTD